MSEWKRVKLGDVCDVRDGTHDSPKYLNEGFPLVTSKNVKKNHIDFSTCNLISKQDLDAINKRSLVEDRDIIMPMIGTIGNPLIIKKDREFAIKNVALIKFNQKNVNNKFLKFVLSSYLFKTYIKQNKRGGTQKFLSLTDIRNFSFPLHNIDIQKHIVSILEKAESLKQKREETNKQTQKIIQSIFYDMFGDLVKNEKKWDVKRWEDVLKISNGRSQKKVIDENGKYPIYGSGGIMGYANDFLTQENSVIIGRKGSINKPIKVKTKFWNVDTAFGLVPNTKKINCDYLYVFCELFNFERLNTSTTLPSLTKVNLLKINMSIPPLKLQEEFAKKVQLIESIQSKQQSSTQEINTLFDALMQKAFKGELVND